jgi:hypothetical protein
LHDGGVRGATTPRPRSFDDEIRDTVREQGVGPARRKPSAVSRYPLGRQAPTMDERLRRDVDQLRRTEHERVLVVGPRLPTEVVRRLAAGTGGAR